MHTQYVSTVITPQYLLSGAEVLHIEDVIKTIHVPYEDVSVQIPSGYDRCLTNQYGDYMKLPPIEQRGQHHSEMVFYDPTCTYKRYQGSNLADLFEKYGYLL